MCTLNIYILYVIYHRQSPVLSSACLLLFHSKFDQFIQIYQPIFLLESWTKTFSGLSDNTVAYSCIQEPMVQPQQHNQLIHRTQPSLALVFLSILLDSAYATDAEPTSFKGILQCLLYSSQDMYIPSSVSPRFCLFKGNVMTSSHNQYLVESIHPQQRRSILLGYAVSLYCSLTAI